jgi:hypothetical protein
MTDPAIPSTGVSYCSPKHSASETSMVFQIRLDPESLLQSPIGSNIQRGELISPPTARQEDGDFIKRQHSSILYL